MALGPPLEVGGCLDVPGYGPRVEKKQLSDFLAESVALVLWQMSHDRAITPRWVVEDVVSAQHLSTEVDSLVDLLPAGIARSKHQIDLLQLVRQPV